MRMIRVAIRDGLTTPGDIVRPPRLSKVQGQVWEWGEAGGHHLRTMGRNARAGPNVRVQVGVGEEPGVAVGVGVGDGVGVAAPSVGVATAATSCITATLSSYVIGQ